MSTANMEHEVDSPQIVCRFYPNPYCPKDGHYQMHTTNGEFLGNVGEYELDQELAEYKKRGYRLSRIIGGNRAC